MLTRKESERTERRKAFTLSELLIVIAIIVAAARLGSGITVETVLVAVLVGFVGTVALARFIERRGD